MTFKINIGNYTEYRPDASLELPSDDRQAIGWVINSAEAYNLDYTVATKTPLLPNNWYWDIYYCAAAGSFPQNVPVAGVCNQTWVGSFAGTFTTAVVIDTACFNGYRFGFLHDTSGNPVTNSYGHNFVGSDWVDNINNAVGYTILWRCKVLSSGSIWGQTIFPLDGIYSEIINMQTNQIKLHYANLTYPMDTTNAYHTYKFTRKGTQIKLYVDDGVTPVIAATGTNASATKALYWAYGSDAANCGGQVYWDFFTYYTGAEPVLMGTDDVFTAVVYNPYPQFPLLIGTVIDINCPVTGAAYYLWEQSTAGTKYFNKISNSLGYVINLNLKVITAGSVNGPGIYNEDGIKVFRLEFLTNSVTIPANHGLGASAVTYAMDTTDDYHDYKAIIYGTNFRLFIDNILRINGSLNKAGSSKNFAWGDCWGGVGKDGEAYWRWVKVKTFREILTEVVSDSDTDIISDYVLKIATSVYGTSNIADYINFAHNSGTAPFLLNANNQRGYTIEGQTKIISAGDNGGQEIFWADNIYKEYLKFKIGSIQLGYAATSYIMTTTDDYYRYRITCKDAAVKVYVNDALRITGTLATTSSGSGAMGLWLGDYYSTYGGQSNWGYVKYNTDGAYPPNESARDGWTFAKFDIVDKRANNISKIIRSKNSEIPVNELSSSKIKISGTIAGTCWDSFKNTVRRLKQMLNSGQQKIYMDESKYMEGIHNNLSLSPITQNFADYTADFDCRYPYRRNVYASYFSTSPVANATFYVVNTGDVDTPVKIIITGAASGSAINFTLDNITNKQNLKYVGSVMATQELSIDSGFAAYNEYCVSIGTGDCFGSYEGDMLTLRPGSNAFVYGSGTGAVLGTLEFYWREAFNL